MGERFKYKQRRNKPLEVLPNGMRVFGYNEAGKQICNSPRPGRGPCQSTILKHPFGRCEKHGGNSLVGLANPAFKHGKYASVMSGSLKSKMLELAKRDSKEYLSSRDDIDLTDLRLSQLAEDFSKTVDKVSLKRFGELAEELDSAMENLEESEETFTVKDISQQLVTLVRNASALGASWEELMRTQHHRSKLVETELKRIEADTKHIAREEVLTNHARLLMAIREVIFDPRWFGQPELQLTAIHRVYTSSGYQPVVAAIEAESRSRKREEEE
jgi:hypothetical protein